MKATKKRIIPPLPALFVPCPICKERGVNAATGLDGQGIAYCESCEQEWNVFGQPLEEDQWLVIIGGL